MADDRRENVESLSGPATLLERLDSAIQYMCDQGNDMASLSHEDAEQVVAALERLEKLEKLLRLIEADDWPGMIELAKQAGIPDVWEHTHNPEDYELTGFHDDDGKYVYPTRANLTAALSRTLLATPAPAAQEIAEFETALDTLLGPQPDNFAGLLARQSILAHQLKLVEQALDRATPAPAPEQGGG